MLDCILIPSNLVTKMVQTLSYLLGFVVAAHALPQAHLGKTIVSGTDASEEVEFFGGLPYAEPPLGKLRFSMPVLKSQLDTGDFNASAFGNTCLQPPQVANPPPSSEDCLFINVYRPKDIDAMANLPVLFWTHGGGFAFGAANQYDGTGLVAQSIARGTPIIYVNINYRLGPLGFPQGREADDQRILNLGIQDQITALQWVQANIHYFGGDKKKVTIFGESAGSIMTAILYLNPQVEKLARAAIFESGSPNSPTTAPATFESKESGWRAFVKTVPSCASVAKSGHTLACLQNSSTDEIATAVRQNVFQLEKPPVFGPTVDPRGSIYPDYVSRLYAKGRFARLPFIAGTNRDEGTGFATDQPKSDEDIRALLVNISSPVTTTAKDLNDTVSKILELYPEDPAVGSPYGTGAELFGLPPSFKRVASIEGDLYFEAPRRQFSQAAAKFGVKSYVYHFNQPQLPVSRTGVAHFSEVAYVFGQIPESDSAGHGLSEVMMNYWISFAASLNPNDGKGINRPEWPQFTTESQVLLQLEGGNTTVLQDDYRKDQMGYLIEKALVLHH
ncbi:triacylglycerol lipase 3 [Ephemerocybe angulata]|uniref:Carboxylic ester hydrolase n=1 Tax=Ephemerocybe angulata TaxID=980116 RepID=A0A8H6LZ73_9AGAR|nr:triacylglycerol lipase 3 [Tulosesus angulatus]